MLCIKNINFKMNTLRIFFIFAVIVQAFHFSVDPILFSYFPSFCSQCVLSYRSLPLPRLSKIIEFNLKLSLNTIITVEFYSLDNWPFEIAKLMIPVLFLFQVSRESLTGTQRAGTAIQPARRNVSPILPLRTRPMWRARL